MKPIDPPFSPVVAAFAGDAHVTTAPMFSSVGLRVTAGFFAVGVRGELLLKMPAARVAELIAAGAGKPFQRGGSGPAMKEWIVIPPGDADWIALAREARRFVAAAKPS